MQESERVKCALAAEVLAATGKVRMKALGCSMLPTIRPGDTLTIVRKTPEELQLGDIIAFARDGALVVHRLVEIRADGTFVTRGDALRECDEPVRDALGCVEAVARMTLWERIWRKIWRD